MSGGALLTQRRDGDRCELTACGEWTAEHARALEKLIDRALGAGPVRSVEIDMARVTRLDTFGAWLLERLMRDAGRRGCEAKVIGLSDRFALLARTVHEVAPQTSAPVAKANAVTAAFDTIGRNAAQVGRSILLMTQMLGALAEAVVAAMVRPLTFRLTSTIRQIDLVGWRAVPIILLITFLIGAIVAQQGIFHFRKFGADVFVIDMIGILVLRELGVLVVCIMVAGRTGSAYTAEIGAMKMREEIDALQTMGLDPVRILILPRVVALLVAVPMLTFLGSMAALYGGGLVAWLYGGISPDVFLQRLREAVSIEHFLVGLIKAPFMALVIGIVACVEGLEVRGSSESLGLHTTAAVVKSIFLVIVMDGLFAIFFAAIEV